MNDVRVANADQAEFWNGPGGETWTTQRPRFNAMLRAIGREALDRAGPQPGERVLDVGCGTGDTTGAIARGVAPDGTVLGIDISRTMIAEARRLVAKTAAPVAFEVADAQTHAFDRGAFDLAFSRFGVMFFEDSVAAFANLRRALKADGRLAFACWQAMARNEWVSLPRAVVAREIELPPPAAPDAPGPFAFGEPARIEDILRRAGFAGAAIEPFETAVPMGGGGTLEAAVTAVTDQGPLSRAIHDAPDAAQARIRAALHEALAPRLGADGVRLGAAAWLVTARRGV